MNSQNFYQPLLSLPSANEINHSKLSSTYRNKNIENSRYISIMEFKEPNFSTFSLLEESDSKNSYYSYSKNKISNIINNLILLIRKEKKEEKKYQGKKERNKNINLSRFIKPSYKKYSYMDYPFYKIYNKEDDSSENNKIDDKDEYNL